MSDDDQIDSNEDGGAIADDWAAAMEEAGVEPDADAQALLDAELAAASADVAAPEANALPLEDFSAPKGVGGPQPDLEVVLDIPVTLSMEVGKSSISIRNLLQLTQGSVIELDRLAGEPLDVMVNGTLVAHGEVVVVNEKFGIRMTDVISPQERIKRLG